MRSPAQVNVRRSIECFVAVVRKFRMAQIRTLLCLVAIGATTTIPSSLRAEEPPKPQIIDFHVSFDGYDQIYLSGQVIGVEDPDGLTVVFDDFAMGYSTETAYGGYFGLLIISPYGGGQTYSATVTSHEGVESDRVTDWTL